jgi:hypothetical protein
MFDVKHMATEPDLPGTSSAGARHCSFEGNCGRLIPGAVSDIRHEEGIRGYA